MSKKLSGEVVMKGFVALVTMILVLAGLVRFSMTAEVNSDDLQNSGEVILLLWIFVGGLILSGGLLYLLVRLGIISEKWMKVWEKRALLMYDYIEQNPMVVIFGQTGAGKQLYNMANAVHQQVDEPTDIAVKLVLTGIEGVRKALKLDERKDPLTPDEISAVLSAVTAGVKNLVDGSATPKSPPVG